VFVDATSGIVVQSTNAIETVKTRYVCDANNTSTKVPCNSGYARSEGQVAIGNADVDSAYDFSGATYDFYFALGRDSIDGAGMAIRSTVRYCVAGTSCPYTNAYWSGTQMVYGAGYAVADDVVAHELTHGVTDYTSDLFSWYQSGAINEAISDIMGEFVDLANSGTGATADTTEKRWLMGEDLSIGAIRNMANPPAFNDPDKISSAYYTTAFDDNGGVHTNSGVTNKTAYLIADGGTFNGQTVTGIGLTKSARLWYQTNITLLHASGFYDLADTLERTCVGLVNLGIDGFVSADCTQVSKAITATELRTPIVPVPAVCSAGVPVDAFQDGFDTGTAAWTIGRTVGPTNLWYANNAASPDLLTMTWPTTASKNVRGVDSSVQSDSTMAMTTGVVIPAGAYLRLNHWFGFEVGDTLDQGYDGGIIEYSSDSGAWTDIGSLTAVNGYNGVVDVTRLSDNPLEGNAGFIGVSNGALVTRYDLTPLAGRTVKFRFRLATDTGTGSYGWYIDDVQVYSCATDPPPSIAAPSIAAPSSAPISTTPAATSTVATPPASGTWTTNATTDVITSRFVYTPGTTYSIKATKGRITRVGTCRKTGATVTCKVKAPNGRWKIIVTPKTGAKAGKAIVRFVKT
jgi:bacillolysin